jgi:hypothetical protein
MEQYAKLLTSIAALVGAVAWPATFFLIIFVFRSELKLALTKLPTMLDRVKKASLAGVAFELDQVATAEVGTTSDKSGKITPRQLEAAARIAVHTQDIGTTTLFSELDKLCLEYDALKRTLPSGENRTRAMTRVLVKMRALAPSLVQSLDAYKGSGSAGSRLAAIAMMQMVPSVADLDWLKDRFSSELPFVFYHAALALQNVADASNKREDRRKIRDVARQALAKLRDFGGTPDANTVDVLESLITSLQD